MQHIFVTPFPEFVYSTPIEQFFQSALFSDILNTSVTLGALGFAFYMFYRFNKYGKFGRDVSKETQEHDRQSLIDHGLIDPAEPASDTNKIAANRPPVVKPLNKDHSIRQNSVKRNENKGANEI